MTEIDFEELDKAVNSLMSDVDKSNTVASATSSNTSATSTTPSTQPSTVSSGSATTAPDTNEQKQKVSSSPLPTKRRGQFMDIVRPTGNKPTVNPVHRQGVTITPNATASQPSETATEAPAIEPNSFASVEPLESTGQTSSSTSVEQPSVGSSESIETPTQGWPDPIDFADATQKPQESITSTPDVAPKDELSIDAQDTESLPLDSPFLPDAKPEKRPLGALATAEEASDDTQDAPSAAAELPQPEVTNVALPAELHGSVVAIESESTGQSVTETPTPAAHTHNDDGPVADTETPRKDEPQQQSTDVPAGGTIPQQYKEQPNTGDQTSGSIYDTANYHTAIEAHATGGKKNSVLKMVIWGVLLLILGAGVGAAVFMFTR